MWKMVANHRNNVADVDVRIVVDVAARKGGVFDDDLNINRCVVKIGGLDGLKYAVTRVVEPNSSRVSVMDQCRRAGPA